MKWLSAGKNCLPKWHQVADQVGLFFIIAGRAFAAESDPAATVAELSAAYAKLDGFTATYRSEGDGKSLECTLGRDEISGLAALHLVAKKGGRVMESRQWNSPETDQVFICDGDDLSVFKGVGEEVKSLDDLETRLTAQPADIATGRVVGLMPSFFLTKTEISTVLKGMSCDVPTWASKVEDAPIKESNDKTVTFLTEEYGMLTISRESGLLTHLSVTSDEGEIRVLELKESHLNPGKQAIEKITAGWSGEGAATKSAVALMVPQRLMTFQKVIDNVDEGKADLGKLETLLGEQEKALRHFAGACISENGGRIASSKVWKEVLNKDAMREVWLKTVPGTERGDEKGFEAFIANAAVQKAIAKKMTDVLLKNENFSARIMEDIFGRSGWASVKSTGEAGASAKQMLQKSLVGAYIAALVERKIESLSSERDGLD